MRYPASEKLEIIRLVEQSHLPARKTLDRLGIPHRTFYRWYDRYVQGGPEALADRLEPHFPVLYRNEKGRVAHECIIDPRALKDETGVSVDDIAKRLMDYGFRAPTMSFPVTGTLMIEPTESESLREIDRFIEAMIYIRSEIADIAAGRISVEASPLRHAPHTVADLVAESWGRPYCRSKGCLPAGQADKYWPPVNRVDNAFGDRNLICSCPPPEEYKDAAE